MSLESLVNEGQLTAKGQSLASTMFIGQCDRRPCSMCSKQNRATNGPGGPGCPATGLTTRTEVDKVLTLYMGRSPRLEALDSILPR